MTPIQRIALLILLVIASTATAEQVVAVPDAEQVIGAPRGTPLSGDALSQHTQEVAAAIRCPVCQGLSVADSPSEMAVNMKSQVRALLARGYTREQVETYFERSYGQFVLLRPKFEGVNTLVWILPIVVLVAGVFIAVKILRGLQSTSEEAPPHKQASTDNPYLARVREMVQETKP